MPIVIDGWNFIRSEASDINDIDSNLLESADSLISRLENFLQTHNDPVIVVFDSRSCHLDTRRLVSPKIKIIASRDADEYIKKYIDATPERQRRNLRVVSSDSAVYYYAKSAYAAPIKSEEFWEKIKRDLTKGV